MNNNIFSVNEGPHTWIARDIAYLGKKMEKMETKIEILIEDIKKIKTQLLANGDPPTFDEKQDI